jgi:hypothetical protein
MMKPKGRTLADNVARMLVPMGTLRNVYRIFVGQAEGKKRLRRHRHRWNYGRLNLR